MPRFLHAVAVSAAAAAVLAAAGLADSTPIGTLPSGPSSTIQTQKGQLVAVALPHRSGGRVWRIARAYDSRILQEQTEADVATSVVLVFKAARAGTTTITFALTKGDTGTKAFEARRVTVKVR